MPTARESLLSAALRALDQLPWSAVRMVDVAASAGVSRQTLYNEFGSKDGLARALVRREADAFFHGVDRLLTERAGPSAAEKLVALAEWTVAQARARPLLRALLTGCWGERLPAPRTARSGEGTGPPPVRHPVDTGPPAPSEVAAAVRDRSLAALERSRDDGPPPPDEAAALAHRCELAVRLALSYVVAPGRGGVGALVRTALTPARLPVPAPVAD
ncbi:TetR/AcrR family transcriptional regulator [Streptomyces sp. NPDC003691]